MVELYRSSTKSNLSLVIYRDDAGKSRIKIFGTPQYVVVYDLTAVKSYIYQLIEGKTKGKASIDEPFDVMLDASNNVNITYIYRLLNLSSAQIYQNIFPYQGGATTAAGLIIKTKGDISSTITSVQRGKYIGIHSKKDVYVNQVFVKRDTAMILPIEVNQTLDTLMIRENIGKPSNIGFCDLTEKEREQYIPECVANGSAYSISNQSIFSWENAKDYIYKGRLTYSHTRDKEIHMCTDDGRKFRYTLDKFRHMIPYINNGVINGSFQFSFTGNKKVTYVLTLCESQQCTELILCDSSDSD
jgi:hypothetical protein